MWMFCLLEIQMKSLAGIFWLAGDLESLVESTLSQQDKPERD